MTRYNTAAICFWIACAIAADVAYFGRQPPHAPSADVVHRLRRDADSGSQDAQYQLGLLYFYGEGVAKDAHIAAKYFKDAANRGHAQACGNLGMLLEDGAGTAQDTNAALTYYKRAGEAGEPEGWFRAALLLYDDRVPHYDEHERLADAFKLFQRARAAGHPQAVFYLAVMLEYGLHMPQNFTAAGHMYSECCQPSLTAHFADSLGADGEVSAIQVDPVPGDPDCCYHKALLVAYGRGFPQDTTGAVQIFQTCMQVAATLAASPAGRGRNAVHGPCALYLGLLHASGQGVPVDYEAARVYLQQAADSGDPRAVDRAKTAFSNLDKLITEAEGGTAAVLDRIKKGHEAVPPEVDQPKQRGTKNIGGL